MEYLHSLLILGFISFPFFQCEACQYYIGEEGDLGAEADALFRRKRNLVNREEQTDEVRAYMTACMDALLPNPDYDWRTNVDFTVLHTMWYLNTEQTYCSPSGSGATKECWQEEITNYLASGSSNVLDASQTCIDHFAADTYAEPPTNRYARSRKRRSSSTSLPESSNSSTNHIQSNNISSMSPSMTELVETLQINKFDSCLKESLDYSSRTRQQFNFTKLSLFIELDIIDGCDGRRSSRFQQAPLFAFRFVALTRPDSPLRNPLENCQRNEYPPEPFWGTWGGYGSCSVTCGTGTITRRRSCRSGVDPDLRIDGCEGETRTYVPCERGLCPGEVRYSWGAWTNLSDCSTTCDDGVRERTRSCIKEEYNQTGAVDPIECNGLDGGYNELMGCNNEKCAPLYEWSEWSPYGKCKADQPCSIGTQEKTRRCLRRIQQIVIQLVRSSQGVGTKSLKLKPKTFVVPPGRCQGSGREVKTCVRPCK